jgi:hypothetical protein
MKTTSLFCILVLFTCSCIVQVPKYAKVEKVLELSLDMTQTQVDTILGIPPYDLKGKDSSTYTLIYKYRVADRRTFPLLVGQKNGMKWRGKYVDLFITYNNEGKVTSINSCSECDTNENAEKRVDIDWSALITLVTITLPSILVAFKLSN